MAADDPVPSLILTHRFVAELSLAISFFQHDGAQSSEKLFRGPKLVSDRPKPHEIKLRKEAAKTRHVTQRLPHPSAQNKKMKAFGDGAWSDFHFPKVPPPGGRGRPWMWASGHDGRCGTQLMASRAKRYFDRSPHESMPEVAPRSLLITNHTVPSFRYAGAALRRGISDDKR